MRVSAGRAPLAVLLLLAAGVAQCDANQQTFFRLYGRDSFARVSIPWSADTRSAHIQIYRFGENGGDPVGTAKVYINAQEPASPSRNIFQGSLDRNVVLKASTIPAGVVEIYVQGPLPPNSFKGFGSGETAKLEGIVVTVAFAGCAVPNLAGFCSLPMQTAATASHLLPSRNADNASVDATSTIAEDGGTTVLVLRDGNPVVIRVPLPLGARSLSLSLTSISDAASPANASATLTAYWTENRAFVSKADAPVASLAAAKGANTSLSRKPPAPGVGYLTIVLRGANLTQTPTHRVSVKASVQSCDQASMWMGHEEECAAPLALMTQSEESLHRTNAIVFSSIGLFPEETTAAMAQGGVPTASAFALHRFTMPASAHYYPGRLVLTMRNESALVGMVVGIRRDYPPSPSMHDAEYVFDGGSPDERIASSFFRTELRWFLPVLGQGEWFVAVGPASTIANRRLEGDSPDLPAYRAVHVHVEEEEGEDVPAPEATRTRLRAAFLAHTQRSSALPTQTRLAHSPLLPLESALAGPPSAGLRGVEAEAGPATASLFYEMSLHFSPCTDKTCTPEQGYCVLLAGGMSLLGKCRCRYRFEGLDCSKKAISDTVYGLHVSLLLVSNLAMVPAIVAAYRRELYGEMVIFASSLVSSVFYHACDTDLLCVFDLRFSMLQVADYTFAVASAVVVVSWYSSWPATKQHLKYGPVVVLVAWSAVAVAGSDSFAIPAAVIGGGSFVVFVTDLLLSIWRRTRYKPNTRHFWGAVVKFVRKEGNFAGKPIAAGFLLVIAAALCVAFQSPHTYFAVHSGWHVCSMTAAFVFLLGRRRWSEYHYPHVPVFRRVSLEARGASGEAKGSSAEGGANGEQGEGTAQEFRAMAP